MFHFDAIPVARHDRLARDVLVVEDPELVAEHWRFLEQTGHATAFQTRAWLDPWLRIVAPAANAHPLFVLVRDRKSGEPQMLLPLCWRRTGRFNTIEFADLGVSDYNAPLIGADFQISCSDFSTLWSTIRASLPKADILRIDKSPAYIGAARNPMTGLKAMHALKFGAWSVRLPASRELYERDVLNASARKELRRKRRRIADRGPLRFFKATTHEEVRRVFVALADMRSARFNDLKRSNILADQTFRRFYETVILEGTNGFAELYGIEVNSVLVAAMFGLRHVGAFSFLLSGFKSGEWKSCSLGNVSVDCMISAAIADGVEAFDFTIGDARFKNDFGAQRMMLYGGIEARSAWGLLPASESQLKGALRRFANPASASTSS